MACDICGNNKAPLVDLRDEYKTREIAQICPECEKIINAKNSGLLSMVLKVKASLLKRFMEERRSGLADSQARR